MSIAIWIQKQIVKFLLWIKWFEHWSKLYQRLFDRSYVQSYKYYLWHTKTKYKATSILQKIKWKKDGSKELFDAAHHPAYFQGLVDLVSTGHEQPDSSCDCEDFALWAAMQMESEYNPKVLCVYWSTGRWPWQIGGHAVCLYKEGGGYGHCGNWGFYGGYDNIKQLVIDIAGKVKKQDVILGYKIYEANELIYK